MNELEQDKVIQLIKKEVLPAIGCTEPIAVALAVAKAKEILSEEMRLLYVALTRAKEKLIITGCDKNLKKSITQKENSNLDIVNIRKAKSYLDWLELVYLKNKEKTDDILASKFDINPKVYAGKNIACEFCQFKDLCFMKEKDQEYLEKVEDLSFLGGEE